MIIELNKEEDVLSWITTRMIGKSPSHPEIQNEQIVPLQKGLSIAWQNVLFIRGARAVWKLGELTNSITELAKAIAVIKA